MTAHEFARPDRPRGTCQVCERSIALNNDGRVRHHSGRFEYRAQRCPGTGHPPKEAVKR